VELAAVYHWEHTPPVLAYWDQPEAITFRYVPKSATKPRGYRHTPDYLIVRQNGVAWVQCKTEEELKSLSEEQPRLYTAGEDGLWHCPPGEAVAKEHGFGFEVVT